MQSSKKGRHLGSDIATHCLNEPNESGRRLHLMSSVLLLRPYESTNTPNSESWGKI